MIKINNFIIAEDEIASIDCDQIESLEITVYLKDKTVHKVTGIDAITLIMETKPSMLEGKRLKWVKRAWMVHNFIGHPLMQILALFGFYKLAIKVHDETIPRPIILQRSTNEI